VDTQTAVVTFQYDNRDRLIHETRVVNGSTTVYDLAYTYDALGNALAKRDEAASPRTKTTHFYDTDLANRDPNYPTNNNRLTRYAESVDNGQGGGTVTRTVKYVYYITGHASNIIVKDVGQGAEFDWYRGLALCCASAGELCRAVWKQWQLNEQQQGSGYASGPRGQSVRTLRHPAGVGLFLELAEGLQRVPSGFLLRFFFVRTPGAGEVAVANRDGHLEALGVIGPLLVQHRVAPSVPPW